MSDTKWTPGPWVVVNRVDENGNNDGSILADVDSGRAVCVCKAPRYAKSLQWQPNAHLIAAAPDLYEALDGILAEIRDCSDPRAFDEWYEPGVAALAKARGEA